MAAANAQRYRSTIEHLRALNYAPHEFICDLAAATDAHSASYYAKLCRHAPDILQALLFGDKLSDALQCLRWLDYQPHSFVADFLAGRDVPNARGRAVFHEHTPDILKSILPGARATLVAAILCLRTLRLSVVDLISGLLRHEDPYASESDVQPLLTAVSSFAPDRATDWAMSYSEATYRREILAVTHKSAGFHANTSHLQPEQIEDFNLPALAATLRTRVPCLWRIFSVILDAHSNRRRVIGPKERTDVVLDAGGDLGGQDDRIILASAGQQPLRESNIQPMVVDEPEPAVNARDINGKRTDGTEELRILHMFAIAQLSSSAQCNMVPTHIGIFLRAMHVPAMVVNVLNHLGFSISTVSIDKACDSLDEACERCLALKGPTLRSQLAYDNFNFLQRVAMAVAGRGNIFVSAISAALIDSHPCLTKEHFRAAGILWSKNPANEMPRFAPNPSPFVPSYPDILNLPYLLDPRSTANADFDPVEDQLATNAWHVRRILVEQEPGFQSYTDLLGELPEVIKIPLHKTEYMPMRALELNQSKTGENSRALDNLFDQMKFPSEAAHGYVTFVHGDLGGSERIMASQADRCDEDNPLSQLKNVVDCPGLFHVRMANTDSLLRLYVSPAAARHSGSSVWKYIKVLRSPTEQAKFTSKSGPGFRRMNDVSNHLTWALILECWTREARTWNASCQDLTKFAKHLSTLLRRNAWATIVTLSRTIAETYIAGNDFYATHRKPDEERDQVFENWSLYLQHAFMDQSMSYAIKTQDVGRVVLCFYDWMFVYHAAKKHKYAFHTMRVLMNLAHVFPQLLRQAFLMSWIINPSGKRNGGRGVDWLVELFNLYLKMVHCGSSSNYGLDRMLKSSTLISLFKVVFDNFVLHYRTMTHNVRHAAPDMTETLQRLRNEIKEDNPFAFTPGRSTPYQYLDALALGQAGFMDGSVGRLSATETTDLILEVDIEDYFDMDDSLD